MEGCHGQNVLQIKSLKMHLFNTSKVCCIILIINLNQDTRDWQSLWLKTQGMVRNKKNYKYLVGSNQAEGGVGLYL